MELERPNLNKEGHRKGCTGIYFYENKSHKNGLLMLVTSDHSFAERESLSRLQNPPPKGYNLKEAFYADLPVGTLKDHTREFVVTNGEPNDYLEGVNLSVVRYPLIQSDSIRSAARHFYRDRAKKTGL